MNQNDSTDQDNGRGDSRGPVDLTTFKVLSDTFFVSLSWIFITLLKPIRSILLGRLLGPYLYGVMNIATPYIQILALAANIGFNDAMTKLIPGALQEGRQADARLVFRAALIMTILLSVLWTVLLLLFTGPILKYIAHQPEAVVPFRLYVLVIPFLALNTFYAIVFIAFQRGKARAKTTLFYGLINVALPIAAVLFRQDINLVILGFVLSEVAGTLIYARFYRKEVAPRFDGPSLPLLGGIKEIFAVGHLFFFAQLGWNLINAVDRVMVKYFMDAEFLGFYTIGVLIVTSLGRITSTTGMALVPSLSAARAVNDQRVYRKQILNVSRLGFIVLAPIVLIIYSVIGDMLQLVLPRFAPAIPVIRILVFVAIFDLAVRIGRASAVACGRGGLLAVAYVITAAWNIAWNWILIPRMGMEGAAYASLSSFLILALLLQGLMKRDASVTIRIRDAVFPVILSLVYPLIYEVVPFDGALLKSVTVLAAGSAAYLFLALITGLVRSDDLAQARDSLEPRAEVPHVRAGLALLGLMESIRGSIRKD